MISIDYCADNRGGDIPGQHTFCQACADVNLQWWGRLVVGIGVPVPSTITSYSGAISSAMMENRGADYVKGVQKVRVPLIMRPTEIDEEEVR